MPKLPQSVADRTDEQEVSGSYAALPEGVYVCVLDEVQDERDGKPMVGQSSGIPYWQWVFTVADVPGQEKYSGRKLWMTTSLGENALWKLKQVFNAFGFDAHTDTDELVGERVKLVVTQQPIERGKRAGEMGNQVDDLMPYEPGEPTGDPELSEGRF